jgi:hypothetical protein
MRSKAIVWVLILTSAFVILPPANYAAVEDRPVSLTAYEYSPQIRVQIGRGRRNRNRNRHWNRGRHRGWERARYNRTRLVRQYYYVNGRRYVRYVRIHY